jgi:hypothetical protein
VHASRSDEQQLAERVMLEALNETLCIALAPARLALSDSVNVQLDGVDEDAKVACEIYARVGRLKGSQPDKVASDLLKLGLVQQVKGEGWRTIYCFADEEAAKRLKGRSWLAAAAIKLNVDVIVVPLPGAVREAVLFAQARQVMVNK